MIARYERRDFAGQERVWVGKYKNLHNVVHWHLEYEVVACVTGSAKVWVDETLYVLSPGDNLFYEGGRAHKIEAEEESILYVCLFDEKIAGTVLDRYRLSSGFIENESSIGTVLARVYTELKVREFLYAQTASVMITQMLLDIFRRYPVEERTSKENHELDRYKMLLSEVDQKSETYTFDDACRFMNFAPAYFSRYFKNHAGMTFSRYLAIVKVEKAIELLNQDPKIKTTELMIRCGFGTLRSFNRSFKEVTGYTPKTMPHGYTISWKMLPAVEGEFNPTLDSTVLVQ